MVEHHGVGGAVVLARLEGEAEMEEDDGGQQQRHSNYPRRGRWRSSSWARGPGGKTRRPP
eukprot:7598658-Pyramimonas_sp.AAC.2